MAGAALSPSVVIILGVANLFADGFSMGMSNFLSQRSQRDYREAQGDGPVAPHDGEMPARTAFATFLAFVAGWATLVPYLLRLDPTFPFSILLTVIAFFAVGASRSLVTDRSWWKNGGEMLVVGMLAAAVVFAVGNLLRGVV